MLKLVVFTLLLCCSSHAAAKQSQTQATPAEIKETIELHLGFRPDTVENVRSRKVVLSDTQTVVHVILETEPYQAKNGFCKKSVSYLSKPSWINEKALLQNDLKWRSTHYFGALLPAGRENCSDIENWAMFDHAAYETPWAWDFFKEAEKWAQTVDKEAFCMAHAKGVKPCEKSWRQFSRIKRGRHITVFQYLRDYTTPGRRAYRVDFKGTGDVFVTLNFKGENPLKNFSLSSGAILD